MAQEYYAIDLPGKILYKKEFNIEIRKITPIEQKFIISLTQKQQKTNKDYLNFIKKLIRFDNPQMKFEELFWFDVQYILYRIRFTTYEKYPIKLSFECDNYDEETNTTCNKEFEQELRMGDLEIITPDDLPNFSNIITLENLGDMPIRNKIINDDLIIEEFAKQKDININDVQMRLLLLDLCLISETKSLAELYALAENGDITAVDIMNIEEWFTKSVWGVKEEIKIKCPKCGKEASRGYILSLEDYFSAF